MRIWPGAAGGGARVWGGSGDCGGAAAGLGSGGTPHRPSPTPPAPSKTWAAPSAPAPRRPAPTSPAEAFRSFGPHGRASVGYGLEVGSTYAGAGRSTHETIAPDEVEGAEDTADAPTLVGAGLVLDVA